LMLFLGSEKQKPSYDRKQQQRQLQL